MFVQHTHRGIEKGKHGRKENERIMAVINDGRTGNDLSTGRRRAGRQFCGAQKGRNEGRCMRACERTTHALGMQSSGSGVAGRGGEPQNQLQRSKGPPSLCGERILSISQSLLDERILLEIIELVSPLTKAEEACIRPFIISLVC